MTNSAAEIQVLAYLAGELSAAEAEQFELALLDDAELRDIYISTLEILAGGLAEPAKVQAAGGVHREQVGAEQRSVESRLPESAVLPAPPRSAGASSGVRAKVFAWGLLTVAVVFAVGMLIGRWSDFRVRNSSADSAGNLTARSVGVVDPADLATAWFELQEQHPDVGALAGVMDDLSFAGEEDSSMEVLTDFDPQIPNWLITALELSHQATRKGVPAAVAPEIEETL